MTEPLFQVVTKKRNNISKSKQQAHSSYNNLLQDYLSRSYGYYTQLFIKRICQKVQEKYQQLRKFQLRKVLRQIIQKYLMTDLEIIFFQYFANLHQWHYTSPVIQQSITLDQENNELNQINCLKLFIHLICFFVKTYVGSKEQVSALIDFHNQNLKSFSEIYQLWVSNCPQKLFHISPRQINQIYTQYSKRCGEKIQKKDYNQMVDKILDLSTTYSIMPSKQKETKSKKSIPRQSKELISVLSKNNSLRNIDSQIWQQNSIKFDFSDLRSSRKDKIYGDSHLMSQINSKIESKSDEKKVQTLGPKKISLSKKRKIQKDEVNNVAKTFFRGKDINFSVEDIKRNESSLKDIVPNSFLDLNAHSSRIQSLPLPYRNTSNILGFSTLF